MAASWVLSVCSVLMLATSAAAVGRVSADALMQFYQYTPAGYVLRNCIHTVPSGTLIKESSDGLTLMFPNGTTAASPSCQRPHVSLPIVLRDLPADYDGWLAYTAFNYSSGFDAFLGSFTVPDVPRQVAHILYLFTGLQNIDWIPLVDPESEGAGFDIIQPVLQYPGDFGRYWSVKSWYVTLDDGAYASEELRLNPGDILFGNMTRTGPTSWYIGGEQTGSGKSSFLNADRPRLRTQPWAYNVLEAYGVSGCNDYPNDSVQFSGLSLFSQGSKLSPAQVQWKVNPKPDPKHFCGESISVQSASQVTVKFK